MSVSCKAALLATIILSTPSYGFIDNLNIQPEYKDLLKGALTADYGSLSSSAVDSERDKIYKMNCSELEDEKQKRIEKKEDYQIELDQVQADIGEEKEKIDKIHGLIESVLSKGKFSDFIINQIDLEVDRSLIFKSWAIKDWIKMNDSYLYTVEQIQKAKCQ